MSAFSFGLSLAASTFTSSAMLFAKVAWYLSWRSLMSGITRSGTNSSLDFRSFSVLVLVKYASYSLMGASRRILLQDFLI